MFIASIKKNWKYFFCILSLNLCVINVQAVEVVTEIFILMWELQNSMRCIYKVYAQHHDFRLKDTDVACSKARHTGAVSSHKHAWLSDCWTVGFLGVRLIRESLMWSCKIWRSDLEHNSHDFIGECKRR